MESLSRLSASEPLTILLVEDNPDDARLVEWALSTVPNLQSQSQPVEPYGGEHEPLIEIGSLVTATRLSEAVDEAHTLLPDVVLLDLDLPDSRGIETLETFISRTPPVPVIVLTGRDETDLGVTSIRCGAQDYIYKGNLTNTLLLRTIRYAVERHAIQHQLRNATDRLQLTNKIVRRQLRNDISVIVGQADELSEESQHNERSVDAILDAAYDLEATADITAEFTEITATRDGNGPTHDLEAVVAAAVNRIKQTTGVSIRSELDPKASRISCRPTLLVAITHLLYDAVDRANDSGEVSIVTESTNSGSSVTISNTGTELSGVHEELLAADSEPAVVNPRASVGVQLSAMILVDSELSVEVQSNSPTGSSIRLHIENDLLR